MSENNELNMIVDLKKRVTILEKQINDIYFSISVILQNMQSIMIEKEMEEPHPFGEKEEPGLYENIPDNDEEQ